MAANLQFVENPTIVVVPPPDRAGRYFVELAPRAGANPCGHRALEARLWLVFIEAGAEAGREITAVCCSACDPARFARLRQWAEAAS